MITFGPNYGKLRISLQLATTRLKILQSKKLEIVEKLKSDVASYIKSGKYMKAKLSAQTIIRDQAAVEAMELIEMYCYQILDRYDLFQQMKVPDISLVIPITSLIWVAPYYQNYVEELKVITKQFDVKYGTRACKIALANKTGKVNPELIERVRQFTPSDEKVENCLRNICSKYGIVYTKKCLESSVNKHGEEFNSNLKTFLASDSDSQFSDKENNRINESFSKKKLFTGNILKFKTKKTTPQNPEIINKTYNNAVSRNNSHLNASSREIEDKCESTTDLRNSSENSYEENFKPEDSLEDKSCRKPESNSSSNISLFDEYCEKKSDVSNLVDSHFYTDSFGVIYRDPPPPYSYQCLPESRAYDRNNTWEDFLFQLPSCPTESPDSSADPEMKEK